MSKEKDSKKQKSSNDQSCVMPRCSSCIHWKSQQAEIEYSKNYGICTCWKWKFTTTNYNDCLLLDRENRSEKHMGVHRFESTSHEVPIGKVDTSRYCFVTQYDFGCIHHNKA